MTDRVDAFADALTAVDRPEVWIHIADHDSIRAQFDTATGPLAGLLLAVKNNVDVEGYPTTAACPGFSTTPASEDAVAVARLRSAGATVVGTTNLDQFATGLVGQRSPYGGVRDARRPEFVSGGSSSGSAVAVALGLADIAIGTDTAGSGRVPAAFQGIVGIKPTLGVVSTTGVLPACRSWDAVTIMARDIDTADVAMSVMAGGDGTRPIPSDIPLAAPTNACVAIPDVLVDMAPGWNAAFERTVDHLLRDGVEIRPILFATFLEAARLLYDGALVAERHAAVGAYVDAHPDEVDPVVGQIISRAAGISASEMVTDLARLDDLRTQSMALLADCDALLVPTAPGQPSAVEVADDPIGVNAWLGTYTNFTNLFDMCGVAVPAGTVGDGQFGVTVLAPAFHDAVALDIARRVHEAPESVAAPGCAPPLSAGGPWIEAAGAPTTDLFVVGAHLPGQPLEHELRSRGARFVGFDRTARGYRLYALDTTPPKPGLVADPGVESAIDGGIWRLSPAALASFLSELPEPMTLGSVELSHGRRVIGFSCSPSALDDAEEITTFGGWLSYLDQVSAVSV
ncbi:allophanate hydrolase [Gordonia hankookensis]|uniref:Allophanate hydrolase n=1 Tax=Gordonia hankookensis TaxID=589403 RepID=A0ABR7WFE4_9ACTN|nr:allophanate hydrolase [Gordonia hankookensis]MBD1320597.1 allophanate hydrolase [Gordonia hankookensis]